MLHFHLSSDRIALAGARKANALAWKRGNLGRKHKNTLSMRDLSQLSFKLLNDIIKVI